MSFIAPSPFDLNNTVAYRQWRKLKRQWADDTSLLNVVELAEKSPAPQELQMLGERLYKRGYALYQTADQYPVDKQWVIHLGEEFGLKRLDSNLCADPDSISTLKVKPEGRGARYIPYTDHPINWHTDGYYNPAKKKIHAFILHCVSPAVEGGTNGIFDIEMAYIALRDENPDFIAALCHPKTMSIPPNREKGQAIRDWETGPVFSWNRVTGRLHMRYTARQKNICWRDDPTTLEAVAFLQDLLTSGDNGVVRHQLEAGQGLICNNSLHCRDGFKNSESQQRLYYRARYFDSLELTSKQEEENLCFG